MNLLRAAATISSFTLLSRITGLVRDMLIARIFGATGATDAYNVAFRLPNLLRRLFAEGAFQQAFVPILADVRAREGEQGSKVFISHVASVLLLALLAVSLLGVLAAPVLVWLIASGLAAEPDTFALATTMTRWMFPYILFMSLVALAASVLNTWKRFAVPAFTPVLLNLSLIAAAVWLAPHLSQPIFALAVGVLAGGAAQLAIQLPALVRIGMLPRIGNPVAALRDAAVRRVLKLMLPALFAVGVAQISIIINTNIASHLAVGSVTWLAFADRLMEFPTALLGVALGTVLLPGLSAAFAEQRVQHYNELLDWGLRLVFMFALPAAVGLGLLADGLVAVLFQGARFTANDVNQTATAVIGYSVGLIGLISVKILAPGFYAQKNIKTPVKIGVVVLISTQIANLVLVPLFSHAGLALSVGLGACLNAGLLFVGLRRRGMYHPLPGWRRLFLSLALALAVLATVLVAAQWNLDWTAWHDRWWLRLGLLAGLIGVAATSYFAVLWLLGYRPHHLRLSAK